MFNLPAELALAILAYLPLSSIAVLPQVCHDWSSFIQTNREPIYHTSAVWHGFVPSTSTSPSELRQWYSTRSLKGLNGWHDFCQRRYDIDKAWSGKALSTVTEYSSTGQSVHRIKVDESAGYILTTKSNGGLVVTDLESDVILWSLPETHVRRYAHCEYGEGYIVFDRRDGSQEVWRRSSDCNLEEASNIVPESNPITLNREYDALKTMFDPDTVTSNHGHFQPWAHLRQPEGTRAFRFSYPTLGVAAWNAVYLWDVRTGALIQTIDNTQVIWNDEFTDADTHQILGNINYIEVSPRYVFLCGIYTLRVFSRQTGRHVLDVPPSQLSYGQWWYGLSLEAPDGQDIQRGAVLKHEVIARRKQRAPEHPPIQDEFIAVHISSCGRHLAILLNNSRLAIIRDFERAINEHTSIYDLALEVQLGSPCVSSRYLAYENGRIAVATRTGVFIVRPDFSDADSQTTTQKNNPTIEHSNHGIPPVQVEILHIPAFTNRVCLSNISCLQMTDTGLFLNWDHNISSTVHDEELFYKSLQDIPFYRNVADVQIVVVDTDVEDEEELAESSTVFSVNFTSL